jgi:hypothetical protein
MQLPLDYGLHLLESLKKGHAGTFTLRPSLGLAGPFIIEGGRGGRFRVCGMCAFLEGATTKSPDTMISITILALRAIAAHGNMSPVLEIRNLRVA